MYMRSSIGLVVTAAPAAADVSALAGAAADVSAAVESATVESAAVAPLAVESAAAASPGNTRSSPFWSAHRPLAGSQVICGALIRTKVPSSISRWISTWSAEPPPESLTNIDRTR